MAHKKGQGSVKNGRDSQSKRLGVKKFGGESVVAGNIIEQAEPQWAAKPLRPHGGVVAIVSFAGDKDSDSAKGLALNTAITGIDIIARVVHEDAHPAQGRNLAQKLAREESIRQLV